MKDEKIVELFFERNENAISEAERAFGKYCYQIAYSILDSKEDAEETVNDTLARAWNSIPPEKPSSLLAYLGKITRNLALNRLESANRNKRRHTAHLVLDELDEVLADQSAASVDSFLLRDVLNAFLASLDKSERTLFICRYYYMKPIGELARELHLTKSNVKTKLYRLREHLKVKLTENGILPTGD